MKLGAQFYSVRHVTGDTAGLRDAFSRLSAIGYEASQMSAIGESIPAEDIRDAALEFGMPVTVTHTKLPRILEETDRVIAEHLTYGAKTVGLGSLPAQYRSEEGFVAFRRAMSDPIKKIRAAGLSFAYHNHAFEFEVMLGARTLYDVMIEDAPELDFIPDTYWLAYAGMDVCAYLRKIGGKRMPNVHFKDMAKNEERSICACGDGVLDFEKIARVCREEGVETVLVEQDNAPKFPDPFEEMAKSYRHLAPIIHKL